MANPLNPGGGYDVLAHLPAGQVLTRERVEALTAAYVANGSQTLTADQVTAAVGPATATPTSLKRQPDSNPQPSEG